MTKSRILFWTRLFSWLGVGCGIPISVFAHKFGLFSDNGVTYDSLGNAVTQPDISLSGWGIISVLLIGSFVSTIFKEVSESYSGYSLTKQCYIGISKTIPFIIAFVALYLLQGVVEQATFCLGTITVCRLISIPLNPLPKWRYDKLGKEDYSTITEAVTEILKNKVHNKGD